MSADRLKLLHNPDVLGNIVGQDGSQYTAENYRTLFRLSGMNTEWRSIVAQNFTTFLRTDADNFMLQIPMLYQSDNFAAIVFELIHLQKLKNHPVQLYAVDMLYMACSTVHYTRETHIIRQIATAGGVEAVIGIMVMNTSCLALQIACTRMLEKLSQYRNVIAVKWGQWTRRQNETAVQTILDAMRKFPLSLDMQSCGASCLGPQGDCRIAVCQQVFQPEEGLAVAASVIYAPKYGELNVDILTLIRFVHSNKHWRYLINDQDTNIVVQQALQYCMAPDTHLESIFIIIELVDTLIWKSTLQHKIVDNTLAISVCLRVLKQVCAHIDTETPSRAIENHKITCATTGLLCRLFETENAVRHCTFLADAIPVLLRVLLTSHILIMEPPPLLFNNTPHIKYKSCSTVLFNICNILHSVAMCDNLVENLLRAGALPMLLTVLRETDLWYIQSSVLLIMIEIAKQDNAQRLLIINSGGLQTLAEVMKEMKSKNSEVLYNALELLQCLVTFRVYATAMLDLGFVEIIKQMPGFTDGFPFEGVLTSMQLVATNPVYL